LGVAGAATASVLVRGGGCLIGIVIALRRGLIRLAAPDWGAVPTIFRVGAPLSLAGVLLSIIYMWLTRFTSQFGTAALAALGVGHKVEGLGFIAISGFALSASALVGQNLGARQGERARQAVRMTVSYCLVVTLTTAVAFLTVPRALVGWESLSPRDRVRSDRADVRDHPRRRARGRGIHLLASDGEHRAHAVAAATRGVVVGDDRAARHLAGPQRHRGGEGRGDDVVLGLRGLASGRGMTDNG